MEEEARRRKEEEGISVLLVDDDADDRDLFSHAMEEIGGNIKLRTFSEGKALLQELDSAALLPDIIFLDLYMPIMEGAECLAEIRSDKRFDRICIVIYSGTIDLRRVEELFRKGANRYLRKPSSYPSLVKSLKRTLASAAENPTGGMTVINYTE